jgi:hypothetical protein
MLRLWYLVRQLVSAGPARSTTHDITQDEHYADCVHVPYLLYALVNIFWVKPVIFET